MAAWAIHETRMRVERRRSASGREGWTVTWKGRGWDRSFEDYLALVRTAGELTRVGRLARGAVGQAAPAPARRSRSTRTEYRLHRRGARRRVGRGPRWRWRRTSHRRSPGTRWPTSGSASSAGSARCPRTVRAAAGRPVRLALKLMNARYDDEFQVRMLEAAGRRRRARGVQPAVVGGAGRGLRRATI